VMDDRPLVLQICEQGTNWYQVPLCPVDWIWGMVTAFPSVHSCGQAEVWIVLPERSVPSYRHNHIPYVNVG
jgi:hypothetical protein